MPRRRRAPLVCKRCGSDRDYYTAGLCRRCHRSAPLVDSCRDCLAWGVTRHHNWLCEACRGWHTRYHDAVSECPTCGRQVVVNNRGYCRLCCRQATKVNRDRSTHTTIDMVAVNRDGQQLFFADYILKKRGKQPGAATRRPPAPRWPSRYPVTHRQLVLFAWPHDLAHNRARPLRDPPVPALAAALHQAVTDYGDAHGWRVAQFTMVWRGIRVLLAMQDTPGARICASDTAQLLDLDGIPVSHVLKVLASVGMLDDDRPRPLEAWFATKTTGLAEPMASEVRDWFRAIRDGSTTAPRTRPRNIKTVQRTVSTVMPLLHAWTNDGHESLREITRDDVTDALAATGARRNASLTSLRSLFRYLKARKSIFANPTTRLRGDPIVLNQPLPIELDSVRAALNSTDPAQAALAALIAFHGLRNTDLRALLLTDVRDGTMQVRGVNIVLADPVRDRLRTWLDERVRRWPNTTNPHLFVTTHTALRTTPASDTWLIDKIGVSPHTIREDRILNEAVATHGDVRRLCDLFGISVGAAQRYADVVTRPDEHAISSRTQGHN